MSNLQIVEISGQSRTGKTIIAKNLAEGFANKNYSNSHFISYVSDLQDQLDLLKYLTIVTNDVLVIDEINQQTASNEKSLINYICANINKLSTIILLIFLIYASCGCFLPSSYFIAFMTFFEHG